MNWLAHLILSDPAPAFRIGGLLPDLVSAAELEHICADYQAGIVRHRQIDAFTDAHPAFRRSVARFAPPFRRYGGILTDIFYDHFIARDWSRYSTVPLPEFTGGFYATFEAHRATLPPLAYERLCQIQNGGWLETYGRMAGIEEALRRLSFRLRRPFDLTGAVAALEQQHGEFAADFAEFFPELVAAVMPAGRIPGAPLS